MAAVKLPDPPPGGGKPDERLRRLESYCAQLNEQLTYILSNLDDRNFTPAPAEPAPEGGIADGNSSPT